MSFKIFLMIESFITAITFEYAWIQRAGIKVRGDKPALSDLDLDLDSDLDMDTESWNKSQRWRSSLEWLGLHWQSWLTFLIALWQKQTVHDMTLLKLNSDISSKRPWSQQVLDRCSMIVTGWLASWTFKWLLTGLLCMLCPVWNSPRHNLIYEWGWGWVGCVSWDYFCKALLPQRWYWKWPPDWVYSHFQYHRKLFPNQILWYWKYHFRQWYWK